MMTHFNAAFARVTNHPHAGRLLLRLTFGILMLFHGYAKATHGIGWIAGLLEAKGVPGVIAYGVYVGEIVAPLLIIVGFFTRPAALIYAFNILVATLLVGTAKFFTVTNVGAWGLETEALYFFGGVVIMLLGAGKYAVAKEA